MPKRAPKRARDDDLKKNEEAPAVASSLMTALMRRGTVSVLEALEVELPEVLKTEVIGKHLPLDSTLNLAQVSKWCRDAVWSPEAVHDFEGEKLLIERYIGRIMRLPIPSRRLCALATFQRSKP